MCATILSHFFHFILLHFGDRHFLTKFASAKLQHPSWILGSSFRPLEGRTKCIHRDDEWRSVAGPSQLGEWEDTCSGQTTFTCCPSVCSNLANKTAEILLFYMICLKRTPLYSKHCKAFAWKCLRIKASQWTRPSRSRPFSLSELALVS